MKRGLSLIAAIFFIIAVASLGMLSISMSSTGAKTSFNLFLKEQAKLLAEGVTEYAVLKVQQHNFGDSCIDKIVVDYAGFEANLTITYMGPETLLKVQSNCANVINTDSKVEKIEAIRIDGVVKSKLEQNDNVSYAFTTIQIP